MITWVKQAIGLGIFAFINMVLFIALSNPFATVMDTISDEADRLDVGSEVNGFIDNFRMIFGVTFVLSFFGLFIWIFLNTQKFEAEQY